MNHKEKEQILKEVKFANWNQWYTDLTNELTLIRRLGHESLFKPERVNEYYSMISNLFSTVVFAIDEPEKMEEKLENIEKNIFSQKYINDLSNPNITEYQRKIIKRLRNILSKMCIDLSDAGLLPKIEKSKKDTRPGAVRDYK